MSQKHPTHRNPSASNHSPKPCFQFLKGNCKFGHRCKFLHNATPLRESDSKELRKPQRSAARDKKSIPHDGNFQQWKRLLARAADPGTTRISPSDVGLFFQLGLGLMEGDIGAGQDAIKRLAEDAGLSFIRELSDRHTLAAQNEKNSSTLWTTEIKPLFQLITHPRVLDSAVLEQHVATIFNFLYGVGGVRIARLSTYLVRLIQNWPSPPTAGSRMEAVVLFLAVLSKIMDCNTTVIVNTQFSDIIGRLNDCLSISNAPRPDEEYFRLQADRYLEYIRRRKEVGDDIDLWQPSIDDSIARQDFVLRRDLPGHLSAQGPRHDNDHADISKIKILPTSDEISSPRGEYLPTTDPTQWHIKGIKGRLDREFRLLREDTVGQLRDTVRETLTMIRKPQIERGRQSRTSVRTYTYKYPAAVGVEFERFGGLELVVRCEQPSAVRKLEEKARREWWRWCKCLQAGALVCVLDATGMVLFCAVSESTKRTRDDERARQKVDSQAPVPTEEQVPSQTLAEDKDFLFVRLQLIEPNQHDISQALRWYRGIGSSPSKYLVEFPGVLLSSFNHTLQALQRMYRRADVPFGTLLAPLDDAPKMSTVEPAQYARKPGFAFDLRCLTKDNTEFLVSPQEPPRAELLESKSSLDRTQAAALLNTLSRAFSLIQGPPGTGKSYTGEKIIKTLLANKKKATLGPIVCVCYTNHALDQLLEHLLDDGISSIIRIGSRSKSDRLQNMNLRTIAKKQDRTKYEGWELYNTTAEIQRIVKEQNKLLGQLALADTWKAVKVFLDAKYPMQHRELFAADKEGWTVVEHKPENAISKWLKGGSPTEKTCRQINTLQNANLSSMNRIERVAIHRHWLKNIRDPIISDIARLHREYTTSKTDQDRIRGEVDLRCLQQADIIGVTTTGLARNLELLRKLRSKVMLCEEAGEVLEAHILTALLPSIEHVILIGDHLQLRPQIQNYELQSTNPRGEQYSLDMSLFERLVKPPQGLPAIPFNILETQRRMHPSIAELVRSTLYPDLKDADTVVGYPKVVGMKKRLFWLHHEQLEAGAQSHDPVNTSHANDFEIEMTTALVSHLVRQGAYSHGDIAVITPYLGQLHRLRRRMETMFEICVSDRDLEDLEDLDLDPTETVPAPRPSVSKLSLLKSVRVATVDNFQGEEAKIIIISLVRSNPQNNCGFLSTSNRINVLLSRAKHGMYIIGNSNVCQKVPMWSNIIGMLQEDNAFGTKLELQCPRHVETSFSVSQPDHFLQFSPEGGCNLPCDKRLSCGHSCTKRCHSDILHNAVKCLEPCVRPLKGCDHSCPKVCGDPCPTACRVRLKDTAISLPCGHSLSSPMCWEAQDVTAVICRVSVKRKVPGCDHEVTLPCHEDVTKDTYRCTAECGHNRVCGHTCKSPCHKCNDRKIGEIFKQNHGLCEQVCGRNHATCRHTCRDPCHGDKQCRPCNERCEVRCAHSRCSKPCHEPCAPCAEQLCYSSCPHSRCTMPCAAPCDWVPCSKRCENTLGCGHQCPSICGEPCPDAIYCQQCGSAEVKSTCVDFLEMKEYSEINLDEDPCLFPDCGHFLTASSMDGQMDLSAYYEMDIHGRPVKVLRALEPFSMQNTAVKVCANCRGPLRNVSRYGRIVRRIMLDEATKKFMLWSNSRYVTLTSALLEVQEELEKQTDVTAIMPSVQSDNLTRAGSRIKAIQSLKDLVGGKRYDSILKLRKSIETFSRAVQKDEQPFQKVADLVKHANRHETSEQLFSFDDSVIQVKGHLLATALLLKCDIVLLSDILRLCKDKSSELRRKLTELEFNSSVFLNDCANLRQLAHRTLHPREEVQSHIFSAQIYMFSKYLRDIKSLGSIDKTENTGENVIVESPVESAKTHVESARALLEKFPSTRVLENEIDAIEQTLKDGSYHPVTAAELRAVYQAMSREFRGTGHWYTCEMGHPFTIGECGMAMEQARCPECGLPVGGNNHQTVAGVRRAEEIEELGRDVNGLQL